MTFDWLAFFTEYGVAYSTHGPNVGRDHAVVKCPFCGMGDPSQHMSVSLLGAGWRCWRNSDHRGRSPAWLVRALLNCSILEARAIVGTEAPRVSLSESLSDIKFLADAGSVSAELTSPPRAPAEFKPFSSLPSARPYINYLERRGFTRKYILDNAEDLGLLYATRGAFAGRIIFLVHNEAGKLVTWTGRAISARAVPRYKSLTVQRDAAAASGVDVAAARITDCLLWADKLSEARERFLFLAEGPIDALKLGSLGARYGVQATCLFTSRASPAQLGQLAALAPLYEHVFIVMDLGATANSIALAGQLAGFGRLDIRAGIGAHVIPLELPSGVGDPGELDRRTFARLFRNSQDIRLY